MLSTLIFASIFIIAGLIVKAGRPSKRTKHGYDNPDYWNHY